jgi:uncharacterized protein YhbP (UPF0306 family)
MNADAPLTDVPPEVLRFLEDHQTLTLATASPGAMPRASTFLYVNEGPSLYFWTRANTTTARQVGQNPVVAFTIDHYSEDLSQTQGIQGVGECSVLLQGEQIARVADLFGRKFPSLSPGSTMSISFFRVTPTELQFIDNTSSSAQGSDGEGTFGAEFHRERSYSIVADLPARLSEGFVLSLQRVEVSAGETLVRQGAPADKFFILLEGEAEMVREEDGERLSETPISAGQLFGEAAIMREAPRAATVRAKSDLRLLALDRASFRDLVSQALELAPDFDQVLRARLEALGGQ